MGRFWLAMILADTPALSADNAAKKTYREYPEWGMMPDAVGFEDEKGARPKCLGNLEGNARESLFVQRLRLKEIQRRRMQ
jgi:hypothetical protein